MQPAALPRAIADLSENLTALRTPLSQCVLASAQTGSLLTGYVVHMLGARLRYQGVAVQTLVRLPSHLKAPEPLPSCFVAQLRAGSEAVFALCTVSASEAGPPTVTVHAYDARGGSLLASIDAPFSLPVGLALLAETNRTSVPTRDREWLKLFEGMFLPEAERDVGLASILAAAEAQYLMDHGLWEAAASRFLASAEAPTHPYFMRGAVTLQLAGRGTDARDRLRQALRLHVDSGPLHALNSWLHLRGEHPEDALPLLEQARGSDMTREGLYLYAHGLIMAELKDPEAAERDFTAAAQALPGALFAQVRLARMHRDRGDMAHAIACYQRAVAAEGATAETWAEMALALDAADRTPEAIEAWQKAFALRPDDPYVSRNLAVLLRRTARFEDALDVLRRAADANPCRADLQTAYGEGAVRLWRMRCAEDAFRRAMEADPGFAYAKVCLAALLQHQYRYAEARVLLSDLLAARPECQPARVQLGRLLGELGHAREALVLLEGAAKSPDSEVDARLAMVEVLLTSGMPQEGQMAVSHAQKAAAAGTSADAYTALSKAFINTGQTDQACAAALNALDKDPRHEQARLAYARALAATGQQAKASEEVAEVLEADPYCVEALELAGSLHRSEGQFGKCVEVWLRALALNPWNADLHRSIAEVLGDKLGDHAGAIEHNQKCIELREMRDKAAR
jgi:tetratricopeptide (TPR) repeat protein